MIENCFPPSQMISFGVPNRVNMFSFKNFITTVHHWKVKQQLLPIWYRIDCCQNILIGERRWKGAHEIYTPHIKHLNFKDVVERHLVTSKNISCPLICITCLDISISILNSAGQKNPDCNSFAAILVAPKWPPTSLAWQWCKMLFVLFSGTHLRTIWYAQCL